jgi:Mce-associated membrane protein
MAGNGVKVITEEGKAEPLGDRPLVEAEDPDASSAPDAEPARRRRRPGRLVAALAVVAALGLAGSLFFGISWAKDRAGAAQAGAVRTTATGFLMCLTNFDPSTVDADFARIASYATGTFARQSNQFFGSSIRQQLESAQASSRGQIRHLYVEGLQADRASVYADVDQTYVNNKIGSPQADELRLVLSLSRQASTWKVSDVNVLQAPPAPGG